MSAIKDKVADALSGAPGATDGQDADTSSRPSSSSTKDPPPELDGTQKKHRLLVAAGPSYAAHSQVPVPVNAMTPIIINSRSMLVIVHVRIRNFHGLPEHGSHETSQYFDSPNRQKDLYSVGFSFIPKRDLVSTDLVWGNDFDYPVRKYLPPGFNYAFKIVKEFIDPGLSCDAYADNPWILGPALSCWFTLRIGEKQQLSENTTAVPEGEVKEWTGEEEHEDKKMNRVQLLDKVGSRYAGPPASPEQIQEWLALFPEHLRNGATPVEEGADGEDAATIRSDLKMPDDGQKRRKHFLKQPNREAFTFEKGRVYSGDFYNPYIDFDQFKLKLPGFSLNALRFVGDKTHTLRYVFKDKSTGELFFCVTLSLLFDKPYNDLDRAAKAEAEGVSRLKEQGVETN